MYMEWLLLLASIPFSRILFQMALWVCHRMRCVENSYGIDIVKKILVIHKLDRKVDVVIDETEDCFNPATNTISLAEKNNRETIGSVAIAIHEVGHALQFNTNWGLYLFRCRIIVMKYPFIYITATFITLSFVNEVFYVLATITLIGLMTCILVELVVEIDASVRGCRVYRKHFHTNWAEMIKIGILLGIAAFTYFVDVFNCIYMIGKLLWKTDKKENAS